ncbi:hypothetical protein FB45DRAFT_877195 [Roridomyces roridus]|uniref:Uncharacterized protein n=1 Tax=Roridomyces roridus TaxID=1738132 RepID=A0AAD7B2Y3_9AGAR|nr:hypothetical protein FB45DRAFT_877195 [Roridomyces roridus]
MSACASRIDMRKRGELEEPCTKEGRIPDGSTGIKLMRRNLGMKAPVDQNQCATMGWCRSEAKAYLVTSERSTKSPHSLLAELAVIGTLSASLVPSNISVPRDEGLSEGVQEGESPNYEYLPARRIDAVCLVREIPGQHPDGTITEFRPVNPKSTKKYSEPSTRVFSKPPLKNKQLDRSRRLDVYDVESPSISVARSTILAQSKLEYKVTSFSIDSSTHPVDFTTLKGFSRASNDEGSVYDCNKSEGAEKTGCPDLSLVCACIEEGGSIHTTQTLHGIINGVASTKLSSGEQTARLVWKLEVASWKTGLNRLASGIGSS